MSPRPTRVLPRRRRSGRLLATMLLTASLVACSGDGDDEADDPAPEQTTGSSEPQDPGSDSTDSTDSTEEPEDDGEVSVDDEPTPPGTVLASDEEALVELPYLPRGRGTYAVSLDAVEKQPISALPPEVDPGSPSDLYYVRQTYTMLDKGRGSVTGMSLVEHTSAMSRGVEVRSVLFADFEGCEVNQFIPEDGASGKERSSCTAYIVPRGDPIDQVLYFEYDSEFDVAQGGEPVAWKVD